MPKVSIVIPTFNRAAFLKETLGSIQRQTYEDWECLVIDDGSSDETPELMAGLIAQDNRFRYLPRPSERAKGANACRNFGFEISQGEYVKWFDSDDLMHEELLNHQVQLLESRQNFDFVACLGYYFTGSLENLDPIDLNTNREEGKLLYNYIAKGLYFLTPAPLWKKKFLEGKPLFDETLSRGQETDFHFRMLRENPRYEYSRERLYFIRRGNADSISANAPANKIAQFSVIRVFDRMHDEVLRMPRSKMKTDLLHHLAYKQLYNIFKLRTHHRASMGELYSATFKILLKILKYSEFGLAKKSKIAFGYALLCARKGYGLLYLPEFDLAKK